MIINIYSKETLEIIGRPVISSLEDFEKDPNLFFPDFNKENHIISEIEYQNPILERGKLREMIKEELYALGKYTLADNELVENNKIKTVELCNCEYIENNQIKLDREKKIALIKKELSELKVEYSEKEFLFQGKYWQKNREVGDRNNLTSIMLMLTASKQSHYDGWKVVDKDTGKDVYLKLSIQELNLMALHMQEQVTKAMKTETALKEKLETLLDEELKLFNAREEFEKLWN